MLLRQTKIWYILEKFIFNKYIETNYTGKICSNDNLLLKQVCLKCQKFIKRDIKTTLFSSFKNILKKGRQSGIDSFSIKIAFKKKLLAKQRWFFTHRNYVEKIHENDVNFSSIEITSKKVHNDSWTFWSNKLSRGKYVEITSMLCSLNNAQKNVKMTEIFWPLKLRLRKYDEMTLILCPLKLQRWKYLEAMWIFWSAKLHGKKCIETTSMPIEMT